MNYSKTEKKRAFRLFAAGKTPEQVAREFEKSPEHPDGGRITLLRAERLLEEYIELPIGEKLRLTLMTECVANRLHRLMDDIYDLRRVDALLADGNEKAVATLLDIKRKIKERMTKEFASSGEAQPEIAEDEIDSEIDKYYEKIFGGPPAQAKVF